MGPCAPAPRRPPAACASPPASPPPASWRPQRPPGSHRPTATRVREIERCICHTPNLHYHPLTPPPPPLTSSVFSTPAAAAMSLFFFLTGAKRQRGQPAHPLHDQWLQGRVVSALALLALLAPLVLFAAAVFGGCIHLRGIGVCIGLGRLPAASAGHETAESAAQAPASNNSGPPAERATGTGKARLGLGVCWHQ